jgi:acyl dehydratase
MKYFEDIQIGESSGVGSYTFTAEAIKSFAARFDPQPFHLDEEAAANSHFGVYPDAADDRNPPPRR